MKKTNNKGFTLIELLAVIVILALLMMIAIPSVTRYITQSRVETVTKTIDLKSIFGEWKAGKYYTLNITLGLDQILWDPAVEDWTEGSALGWAI